MSEIGKLNPLRQALPQQKSNAVTEEKLREVSDMYEKHFIREMMKQMRSTVKEGGFIKQNNAEKIFRDQLDDQYADQWGKAGGIGLSNLIYDQLMERYGAQLGLKTPDSKVVGPIDLTEKSNISTVRSTVPSAVESSMVKNSSLADIAEAQPKENLTLKIENSEENTMQELKSPWAGVLLDKKHMDMGQMQYRIKHDNGLESLLVGRGTGLGQGQNLSVGDKIEAGQKLGLVDSTSPLFWTIKPSISE